MATLFENLNLIKPLTEPPCGNVSRNMKDFKEKWWELYFFKHDDFYDDFSTYLEHYKNFIKKTFDSSQPNPKKEKSDLTVIFRKAKVDTEALFGGPHTLNEKFEKYGVVDLPELTEKEYFDNHINELYVLFNFFNELVHLKRRRIMPWCPTGVLGIRLAMILNLNHGLNQLKKFIRKEKKALGPKIKEMVEKQERKERRKRERNERRMSFKMRQAKDQAKKQAKIDRRTKDNYEVGDTVIAWPDDYTKGYKGNITKVNENKYTIRFIDNDVKDVSKDEIIGLLDDETTSIGGGTRSRRSKKYKRRRRRRRKTRKSKRRSRRKTRKSKRRNRRKTRKRK